MPMELSELLLPNAVSNPIVPLLLRESTPHEGLLRTHDG